MLKMDPKCVDNKSKQAMMSAKFDYKPDTFAGRGIFSDGEIFLCIPCNKTIKQVQIIPMHIVGKQHCLKLEKANASYTKVDGYFVCKLCTNYHAADWKTFLYHFHEKRHFDEFKNTTMNTSNQNSRNYNFSYATLMMNQIIEHEPGTFYCCYCKELVVGKNLILHHIYKEMHQERQKICDRVGYPEKCSENLCQRFVKNSLSHVTRSIFHCNLCNSSISGTKSCRAHIRGSEHIKNLITRENSGHQFLPQNEKTNEDPKDPPPKLLLDETSESLAKRMRENSIIGPLGTNMYDCKLCGCTLFGTKSVLEHVLSNCHRNNMKTLTEECDEESKPATKSEETSDVSSLRWESDRECLKVNMQHIYEVNPEKLRTIKLSCQLCFPQTSNMIYCLICKISIASRLQTFYEHICSSEHTIYLAEAEQNDKHLIDYPDQFSHLKLGKEFMQNGPEDSIQCFACNVSMHKDRVVILEHIEEDSHKELKQLSNKRMEKILQNILVEMESTWYNIQKYWCQLCDIEYNTEIHFAKHMYSKEHISCLEKIGAFQNRLVYDSCIACARLWLGFSGIYTQHCKEPMHEYRVQNGNFLVCELRPQAITLLENAEAGAASLIQLSDQVLTVHKAKSDTLLKCLEDTVRPVIPHAKAYPFGSRVTGLGFPGSDIDVFLDCGTYDGNNNFKGYQEQLIISVEQCLYTNQRSWEIKEALIATRTPIIKLRHRDTELNCDVSFKNGLSVENTKLLKCFINNYPLCRKLMLFLKKWLSFCNLSGSQYISNYAACWYVIFYLQSKSILPSVASLIAKENRSKIIAGWETGISETFDVVEQEYTFTELLHGLFDFYTTFDFRDSVACPILGRTILKQDFKDLHLLPKEMAPYINHVVTKSAEGFTELFRIDSEMCIQDPYDLSHNLTKAVGKFTLHRFKRLCAASADLLNNFTDRSHITSRGQGAEERWVLTFDCNPYNSSKILKNITYITKENAGQQSLLKNDKTDDLQDLPLELSQNEMSESLTEQIRENSLKGPSGTNRYDCKLCGCILVGGKSVSAHVSSKQHIKKMTTTKEGEGDEIKPTTESEKIADNSSNCWESNGNSLEICEAYEDELGRLKSFRASTFGKHKNTESEASQKKNSQLDVVEASRELELLKNTLTTKIEPDIRRMTSVPGNLTGLENPLNKLTIVDLNGENPKKLPQNQLKNSTDQTPRHLRSRKPDTRLKSSRAFDPKYLNVNMQHIYEVNPEKLRMMKLSCQLCFPKTSNMIYCLICERSVASKLQTFYEHICSSAHIMYLAEAEKNDEHFTNYPDQFSNLMIAKEFMQEGEEETIQCFACDASVRNDDSVIHEHINGDFHRERKQVWNEGMEKTLQDILVLMESTWYNIQKYWCQPCNIEYNAEFHFAEHLDSKDHRHCLTKLGEFQNRLVYDSCIACAMLWLGFSATYGQHCGEPMHKYLTQSGDYFVCQLPNQAITLLENSEAEVINLIELCDQVLTVEKAKSDTLLKCLENTVKPIFPNARAYPFGSRVSGLGFPDSDIDVFLDCGMYGENNITKNYREQLIISVEQCLLANQQSWEIEETLATTRTPIIKLRHRDTELSCDVSFKNGLSVENTKLLKCFIDNYPLCRKLMLFLKKWLSVCNLSGSHYITNYASCWYVIFYLQSKSILPSVASLIAKENKSKIIDGWETGISESFNVGEQKYTFTKLLHGFFVFYTNFDYRDSVACPILGRTVLKQDFTQLDLLPKEMAPYVNHVVTKSAEGLTELFRIDSEMCIQDPYDLSHNLTKAVRKFTLNRFKRLCSASADILNQFVDRPHPTSPSQRCEIL